MIVKRPYPTKTIKVRPVVLQRLKRVGRSLGIRTVADTVEMLVESELGRQSAARPDVAA